MRIALAALILACAIHPAQTQTFTTIHNFTGASADGFSPYSPLVRSGKVLYGTTLSGGAYNSGASSPSPRPLRPENIGPKKSSTASLEASTALGLRPAW